MHKPPMDPDGLFGVDAVAAPMMPTEKVWPGLATWTHYRRRHIICDICIKVIHTRGVAEAPPANPASWCRRGPNDTQFICNAHHSVMAPQDAAARRESDERKARAAHLAKAARR